MNSTNLHAISLFPDYETLAKSRQTIEAEESSYRTGAIYTKPEIVNLILDLSGYVESERLFEKSLLEPGCGECGFLTEIISRLMRSYFSFGGKANQAVSRLKQCIIGIDIDASTIRQCQDAIQNTLQSFGLTSNDANALVSKWLIHADFLLHPWNRTFDYVIGNPPYIRIEDLPKSRLSEYRRLFITASNRSDLYICFFELGLKLLSPDGILGFICTNRFVKNQYGAPLRNLLTTTFHVRYYVDLEHTQPFLVEVSAYPAIFIVDRKIGEATRTATLDSLSPSVLNKLQTQLSKQKLGVASSVSEFRDWYKGEAPWISTCNKKTKTLQMLDDYPVLEESGDETKAGIGVATGADKIFIVDDQVAVEREVLLPLALAGDISNRRINWSGHYVINPFASDGSLLHLNAYPLLQSYFEQNAKGLKNRHVAKRNSDTRWYRTIDRIWPDLTSVEKLLIPDIQTSTVIGYDEGSLYPHHNLYFITSKSWNLRALKAILRSSIVMFQMKAMSVQMRGGAVRFQTQSLRKLHIPFAQSLSQGSLRDLIRLSSSDNQMDIDEVASSTYGFTAQQASAFSAE